MSEQGEKKGMHRRRITLADGRYLIFYTFDGLPAPETESKEAGGRAVEKQDAGSEPRAEEERRV